MDPLRCHREPRGYGQTVVMVALGARGSPRAGSHWLFLSGLGWGEARCAGLSPVPRERALGWDSPAKAGWAPLLAPLRLSRNLPRQSWSQLSLATTRQQAARLPQPRAAAPLASPKQPVSSGEPPHASPIACPVPSRMLEQSLAPPIILPCPSAPARTALGASHHWGAPATAWKMQGNGGRGRRGGLGP